MVTDSNDDKVRLYLFKRYTVEGTVNIYRDIGSGAGNDQVATATKENPYGTVTVSRKAAARKHG